MLERQPPTGPSIEFKLLPTRFVSSPTMLGLMNDPNFGKKLIFFKAKSNMFKLKRFLISFIEGRLAAGSDGKEQLAKLL